MEGVKEVMEIENKGRREVEKAREGQDRRSVEKWM